MDPELDLKHAANQYTLRGYKWMPYHYDELGALINTPFLCSPKEVKRDYYQKLKGVIIELDCEVKITEENLPPEVINYAQVYASRTQKSNDLTHGPTHLLSNCPHAVSRSENRSDNPEEVTCVSCRGSLMSKKVSLKDKRKAKKNAKKN